MLQRFILQNNFINLATPLTYTEDIDDGVPLITSTRDALPLDLSRNNWFPSPTPNNP